MYRTHLDGTRLKLRMKPDADAIAERAVALKRRARRLGGGQTSSFAECRKASNWKPDARQANRRADVLKQFVRDGEHANAAAYEALYDKPGAR